jgi:hypothetical protein
MIIRGQEHQYELGKLVRENSRYRLYLCVQVGTDRECLLQIAAEREHSGMMDRAAYFLRELKLQADKLEAEYEGVKTDPKMLLNYDLGFPELVESFFFTQVKQETQTSVPRRVNILAFRNIDLVEGMVPASSIIVTDKKRVDLRTSAWIMGKSLKLLTFVHDMGISIGNITTKNFLVAPADHHRYVVFFDWLDAQMHPENRVPAEDSCADIAKTAQVVVELLGGDYAKRIIPDDGEEVFSQYAPHLLRLANFGQHRAAVAHAELYKLIRGLWKTELYPFTTLTR